MSRILLMILMMLFGVSVFAAGGGSMDSGSMSAPIERKSPRELAIDNYNRGIAHRDKAWKFQDDARTEQDDKKRVRLESRATREFKNAAKRFRTAIKYEPALYQAHGSLGYALRQLGDYEASLTAYNESLTLRPDYSEAIEYRAEANLALGNIEEAKTAYVQLLQLDRPRADELMNAVQAFLKDPPSNVAPEALADLREWSGERMQLSEATRDLTGAAKADWTPAQ